MTPSKLMFETLGRLSVPKRIFYNKAILTYKALNILAPAYITNLLPPIFNTDSFSLRSQENGALCIPRSCSALYDRSFSHSTSNRPLAGYGLPPPRGNFVDHIFLEAQCLARILQHVSLLTIAALRCNSQLHTLP